MGNTFGSELHCEFFCCCCGRRLSSPIRLSPQKKGGRMAPKREVGSVNYRELACTCVYLEDLVLFIM